MDINKEKIERAQKIVDELVQNDKKYGGKNETFLRLQSILNSSKETNEPQCIFCGKDFKYQTFRKEYTLIPWTDDPDDQTSLTKIAKPAHKKCFNRFIELNKTI